MPANMDADVAHISPHLLRRLLPRTRRRTFSPPAWQFPPFPSDAHYRALHAGISPHLTSTFCCYRYYRSLLSPDILLSPILNALTHHLHLPTTTPSALYTASAAGAALADLNPAPDGLKYSTGESRRRARAKKGDMALDILDVGRTTVVARNTAAETRCMRAAYRKISLTHRALFYLSRSRVLAAVSRFYTAAASRGRLAHMHLWQTYD